MRPNHIAVLATLLVASSLAGAHARTPTRHFDLVNASFDSVTSLAVAPAGDSGFREVILGAPLHGGHNATTVELPDGGCLRDFRAAFADGRTLLYPGIDVCRASGLRLTSRDDRTD
ncbi:MAG TPA: hypothetical protein VM619_13720 [Luteimonas sp.]|nr:hypothetical protein [Luteimonas sp.]